MWFSEGKLTLPKFKGDDKPLEQTCGEERYVEGRRGGSEQIVNFIDFTENYPTLLGTGHYFLGGGGGAGTIKITLLKIIHFLMTFLFPLHGN